MKQAKVIVIGAGFGGLYATQTLANMPVDVLLIDRKNFHTFTPLLYQVATCGLDPSEVAYPIRNIFANKSNINFMMGEVQSINTSDQKVFIHTDSSLYEEEYDYLIIAGGSVTNFFGNKTVEQWSFGLKDLSEAVILRNHILKNFEQAAWTTDKIERNAFATMVVIGGGPTGLETAGGLHELYKFILQKEYHGLQARVILVEATDRLLTPFPERLQQAAYQQLTSLGVEIIFNNPVQTAGKGYIHLQDGQRIDTHTIIWAAGVQASPLAHLLDVELQRGSRVPVKPTLEAIGLEHIYVIGDMAYLEDQNGTPYPQLIPVAKQQGRLAAFNIARQINGQHQVNFEYRDRGIMATIGRSRAVAWIYNRIPVTGYVAWIMWLGLHLIWLLGFRNRLSVLIGWIWNYFTYERSVRIILEHDSLKQRSPDS